jgi:protein-tyrosine phosphatase
MTMIKVLMVCLGNICRSPMAEAVFQQQVKEAGLENEIMVDSAGTGSWHAGEKAHEGTLKVLKKNDVPYDGRARSFVVRDLSDFDYILAMDTENFGNIKRVAGGQSDGEIALFLSYANAAGTTDVKEVPDPYYDGRFDYVYTLVEKGSRALLDHIRQKHNL